MERFDKKYSAQEITTGPVRIPDFLTLYFENYEVPVNHLVIWRHLWMLEDITPQILEQAMNILLVHHDALRSRFVKENSIWKQYILPPNDTAPYLWTDVSLLTEDMRTTTIQAIFKREIQSLSLTEGPLIKCVYFHQGKEAPGRLFVIVNHMVADRISMQIVLEDLRTIIWQLQHNHEVCLPRKTTSIKKWNERLLACATLKQCEAEIQQLVAYKRSWPAPSLQMLPLDFPQGNPQEKSLDFVDGTLSLEETDALIRALVKSLKANLLEVLQSALIRTIAPWAGVDSLPVGVVIHGRDSIFDDINVSRTVGFFAIALLEVLQLKDSAAPIRTPQSHPRLRFAQALLYSCQEVERSVEASEEFCNFYTCYNPQVTLNYFGKAFDPATTGENMLWLDVSHNGLQELGNEVRGATKLIDCLVTMKRIKIQNIWRRQVQIIWLYSPRYFRRSTIERLAQHYIDELRYFISLS